MTEPSPEQVERDIDQTRDHIIHIIDEMQNQVSPRRLAEHAVDYARSAGAVGGDFGRNLAYTVRDNPVPAALLGLGLAWLMVSSRSAGNGAAIGDGQGDRSTLGTAHSTGGIGAAAGNVRHAAEDARHKAAAMADEAKARAGAARESAAEAARRVREGAGNAGQRARDYAERAGRTAQVAGQRSVEFAREHPLVVAAAAVGAGALLAAMIPRTRREDELMGSAADHAREAAREAGEVAREAATRATQAATEEAQKQGLTRDKLDEEGATIVHAGAEAAKAAGREAQQTVQEKRSEAGGAPAAGSTPPGPESTSGNPASPRP